MKYLNLIVAILMFGIFALDLEYDRDIFTWLWLLLAIVNFIEYIIYIIVFNLKQHITDTLNQQKP